MLRFLWPEMLWLLLALPLLVAGYLFALRRKKKSAIRYASLLLVRGAIGPRQTLRRHVPPLLFLLALTAGIIAIARPTATMVLPADHMTLILGMDVSRSMLAKDVAPNRISAAQAAVKAFVDGIPSNIRVGIVSFAGSATVVQTPTTVREELITAVDRFQLQRGTATGAGLLLSLAQLLPEAGIDVESGVFDKGFSRQAGESSSLDRTRKAKKEEKNFVAVPPGSYTGGAIVLLSDGRRTSGPDPLKVAQLAADRGVRVYTVGFGTKDGAEIPGFEGFSYFARLDEETLKGVASITGAEYFHASNSTDLKKVYEKLNTKFTLERGETEVSALLSIFAALLLVGAATLSLLWFHRTR